MEPQTDMKNSTSILLVDDDKFLLNMYARKLEHSGFRVESAENGQQALDKLKSGYSPDVILCDVIMPGMDGFTFIKEMRQQNLTPKSKIIMLTNQSEFSDQKVATELGVAGYIIKAVSIPSEVVTRLREIMAGKRYFSDPF